MEGVWESAWANVEMSLVLKEPWKSFRADPEVQEVIVAAGVPELELPTAAEGETYADLLADRSAFEDSDLEVAMTKGYGFARLQRLEPRRLQA